MTDNHNGNIFDDDDALDYILYEECKKEAEKTVVPRGFTVKGRNTSR